GLAGLPVMVIGLGASGLAAARVLVSEGAKVPISERRPAGEIESTPGLADLDVAVLAGGHDEAHLEGASLVVTSPGVPEHAPILQASLRRGIPVWSELELGARMCTVPYVAITGTNG